MSLRKRIESSVSAVNKNEWLYRSIPFMSTFFLIKPKRNSKAIIKKYTDIGSPLNVNYWVAKPPFITQDCWSSNNILIQLIKLLPKPNFLKMCNNRSWSKESKAFSRFIVTREPGIFSLPKISMLSEISLSLSLMRLFYTYTIWFEDIIEGKIGLSFTVIFLYEHRVKK